VRFSFEDQQKLIEIMITPALSTLSAAEVVLQYPNALQVFNKFHIDYCCGGHVSFQEACDQAGVDFETVWNEIASSKASTNMHHFDQWSPSLLVDYIVDQHHAYVRNSIPELQALLARIVDVHGRHHPELLDIQQSFSALSEELMQHMLKEEHILFPAIKSGAIARMPLQGPIAVMMEEHQIAGNLIKEIRDKSCNYTLPDDVCTTYRLTLQKLEAFDNDLMQHIHLENNILFRKVN